MNPTHPIDKEILPHNVGENFNHNRATWIARDGRTLALVHRGSGTADTADAQKELVEFLTADETRRHRLKKPFFHKIVENDIAQLAPQLAAMDKVIKEETGQDYDSAKHIRGWGEYWRSHLQTHSVMFLPSEGLEHHGRPDMMLGHYPPGSMSWPLFMQGDTVNNHHIYSGLITHSIFDAAPGKIFPFKDTFLALPGDIMHWLKPEDFTTLAAIVSESFRLYAHCQPGGMYMTEREEVEGLSTYQRLMQLSPRHKIEHIMHDGTRKQAELPGFIEGATIMNYKVHQRMYQDNPARREEAIDRLAGFLESLAERAETPQEKQYAGVVAAMALGFTPPSIEFSEIRAKLPESRHEQFDEWLKLAKNTHYLQERAYEKENTIPYGPDGASIPVTQHYLEAAQAFDILQEKSKKKTGKPAVFEKMENEVPAAWLLNAPITESDARHLDAGFSEMFTGRPGLSYPQLAMDGLKGIRNFKNTPYAQKSFKNNIAQAVYDNQWNIPDQGLFLPGRFIMRAIQSEFLEPDPVTQPYGGFIGDLQTELERKITGGEISAERARSLESSLDNAKLLFQALRIHATPFKPIGFEGVEHLKDYHKTLSTLITTAQALYPPKDSHLETIIQNVKILQADMTQMEHLFDEDKTAKLEEAFEARKKNQPIRPQSWLKRALDNPGFDLSLR